jgi:hypothetical protein
VATVYHYTDTQAFKGVIENAALWATDFRWRWGLTPNALERLRFPSITTA